MSRNLSGAALTSHGFTFANCDEIVWFSLQTLVFKLCQVQKSTFKKVLCFLHLLSVNETCIVWYIVNSKTMPHITVQVYSVAVKSYDTNYTFYNSNIKLDKLELCSQKHKMMMHFKGKS